jgi:hypothetical protein
MFRLSYQGQFGTEGKFVKKGFRSRPYNKIEWLFLHSCEVHDSCFLLHRNIAANFIVALVRIMEVKMVVLTFC